MKLITIAIAFVASAAFANPTAGTTTTEHGKPAAAAHGKAMKKEATAAAAATAPATCTEADAKAGKCTPEAHK